MWACILRLEEKNFQTGEEMLMLLPELVDVRLRVPLAEVLQLQKSKFGRHCECLPRYSTICDLTVTACCLVLKKTNKNQNFAYKQSKIVII